MLIYEHFNDHLGNNAFQTEADNNSNIIQVWKNLCALEIVTNECLDCAGVFVNVNGFRMFEEAIA